MKTTNVNSIYKKVFQFRTVIPVLGLIIVVLFQNCKNGINVSDISGQTKAVEAAAAPDDGSPSDPAADPAPPTSQPPLGVCQMVSCVLDPITDKPAVTTILLALGDAASDQLVVNGASAQLIAETVIRYTTPVKNPKILFVADRNNANEDPEDTAYAIEVLLKRYNVVSILDPENGLLLSDTVGYDLIWFNNPGHPMGSVITRNTLQSFKGGVVLQGDDLAHGNGFSMENLTGLKYIDNGVAVQCGAAGYYPIDNNSTGRYDVKLNSQYFPTGENSQLSFSYGNDIDNTEVIASAGVQVLATAKANSENCPAERPAIVRYFK